MNFKKIISSTAALLIAGFSFAYNFSADEETGPFPSEQRQLVITDNLHVYNLDPHTSFFTSEAQLLTGLYEGLFSYDPVTLEPIPAICTSYKISRDKKRWTFTLRDNAKFSDGSPITAQSVKYSWLKLLSTPNAPFASMLDFITGAKEFRTGNGSAENVRIDVKDDYTVVIRLNEPAAHLPKLLCHNAFSIVSEKEKVYSGAFYLESYADNQLVMKKNFNYWGSSGVLIPGITVLQSEDFVENSYLFNTGKSDWINGMADISKIIKTDTIQVNIVFGTSFLFFKINNEPWDKPEIRNALLQAVPYDTLRAKYTAPASTLIYPLPGYSSVKGISDYDEEDALDMMNAARKKYGIGKDEKLPLVFACTTDEYQLQWADILKKAWEPLGVDLIIQTTSNYLYNASISSWNADMFNYSWIGDFADPLAFLELFRSDSSLNVSNYKNNEFDNFLLEAARSDFASEQYKLYGKAEQLLLDEGMLIPLSHTVELHIIDLDLIGGWSTNALDIHPLKYLYIKHKQTTIPNLVRLDFKSDLQDLHL